jgi:hypothetical protein
MSHDVYNIDGLVGEMAGANERSFATSSASGICQSFGVRGNNDLRDIF